jgi:hypothetical protein
VTIILKRRNWSGGCGSSKNQVTRLVADDVCLGTSHVEAPSAARRWGLTGIWSHQLGLLGDLLADHALNEWQVLAADRAGVARLSRMTWLGGQDGH